MLAYRRTNEDLVLMLADVTERKRLKEQLQQAQKMEAIGTLAGGIAHDFNNILGALMGNGELALLDLEPEHASRPPVEKMLVSCNRAKDLVSRILAFSRQTPTERSPVYVDQVVAEVLQLMRAAIPATIDIRQQIDCTEAAVFADQTQIHQIIMNLCTNAHHAMRKQGGILTVTVDCRLASQLGFDNASVEPDGEYICVSVHDTGTGMDDQTLRRAFEPYFTTKIKGEGTGLGLAVVHGLVQNWEGAIQVDSVPGRGTTVRIALPRAHGVMSAKQGGAPVVVPGNGRILLVDDEEALVLVGQKMLAHAGYEVVAHTCPQKALERFKASPELFELVITDMTMPRMTGDQLKTAIHKLRPDVPVILCTGNREMMEASTTREAGFAAVLMKPLCMDTLLQTVASTLKLLEAGPAVDDQRCNR